MNRAAHIEALFPAGVVAFQTRDAISADTLLPGEQHSLLRAAPKRQQEFAAGRACARAALAQLGFPAVALPRGEDRAPQWPAGVTGSITHTGGYCAAAVAMTGRIRAVGLDAESRDSVRPHLWERICTAEELAALQALEAPAALAAATLIFSAKEAFYKCQHALTGEWLGFADIHLSIETDCFAVQPTRPLRISGIQAGPWRGRHLLEAGLVITGLCIV